MRIGMCSDMYTPHVSGVTNHIRLYKKHFEDLGHEVFVFTFGDRDHVDSEPNVYRTPAVSWGDTGWNFAPYYSLESKELLKTMDVIHAHHPFQSGRLAASIAKKADIPLVFTNHTRYDLYSDAYASLVPQGPRYGTLKLFLKKFLDDCGCVVAPSKSIEGWLRTFIGCDHVVTVPNGIDIAKFADPATVLTRKDLGLSEDDFVFIYLGRVAPEKNTDYLFSEFFETAANNDNARMVVVGAGPELEKAKAMAARHELGDRLIFTGMQPYDLLPSYAHLADAFVTGSVSEVHPLVVLEAMAAGLPIVAVSSPGISDTVEQGRSGLLAKTPTPSLLAIEMDTIINTVGLRDRLAAGASERIKNYSFANTADVILSYYKQLIG
ncbi:MAG: glycosyltransferase [Coriobacteriia bacterium]|nr:glycosyltransferase [Coriobacteriia bacterium]